MSDVATTEPHRQFQEQLYELAKTHYGLIEEKEHVSLPKEMQGWFFNESQVDKPQVSGSGFFWQRLAQYVNDTEPSYYRLNIEPGLLSTELRALAPKGLLMLMWLRIQFEAHQLIETPLALAVGEKDAVRIPNDFLLDQLEDCEAVKAYFTPLQLERRLVVAKGSLRQMLATEITEIQATMGTRLAEEMGRIREYYGHLQTKTTKFEEKERLRREQKTLEQEHYRRLHPASLKIIAIPELLVALTFHNS